MENNKSRNEGNIVCIENILILSKMILLARMRIIFAHGKHRTRIIAVDKNELKKKKDKNELYIPNRILAHKNSLSTMESKAPTSKAYKITFKKEAVFCH